MGPVEIEIDLKQNVSGEADKAAKGMDDMTGALADLEKALANPRKAMKQMNDEIVAQKELLADMKGQMAMYAKESAKGSKEAAAALSDLQKEYEEESVTLEGMVAIQKALSAEMSSASARATQLKNDMTALRAEGKENTEQYAMLREEYEKLLKSQAAVKNEFSKRAGMEGAVQGISGLAGALSAGAGALGLFNAESENLAKIQTRVQSLMALTIGLQQASTVLNERSAFMTHTVAKAKTAWANAVKYLNVQLGISNTLSKVLVASGIGAIIAAVGLAITAFQKWKREQEEVNKVVDKSADVYQEYRDKMAGQITEVEALRIAVKSENATLDEKHRAITKLKDIIPGYNAELSESGELIRENTKAVDEYVASLEKQARHEAAKAKLQPLIDRQLDADLNVRKIQEEFDKIIHDVNVDARTKEFAQIRRDLAIGAWNATKEQIQRDIENVNKLIEANIYILGTGGSKTGGGSSRAAAAKQTENLFEAERKAIQEQILLWERYFKYLENGYSDLAAELLIELQKNNESLESYLAEQKAAIMSRMADISNTVNLGVSDEAKIELVKELKELSDTLDLVIEAEIKISRDNAKEQLEQRKTLNDFLREYATFTQKKLEIDAKYAKMRETLERSTDISNKEEALQIIDTQHQKDIDNLTLSALKAEAVFNKLGGSIKKMSDGSLKKLLADLNQLKLDKRFSDSAESVKAIDEAIEQVNATIEEKTIANIDKMRDAMIKVVGAVDDVVDRLGLADAEAGKALKSMNSIVNGFLQGGIIGGISAFAGQFASALNQNFDIDGSQKRAEAEAARRYELEKQNYEFERQLELLVEINRLSGDERISARAKSIEDIAKKEKEIAEQMRKQKVLLGMDVYRSTNIFGSKLNIKDVWSFVFSGMSDDELINSSAQDLADRYNKAIADALASGKIDAPMREITAFDIENNEALKMYLDQLKELAEVRRQLEDEQLRDDFGIGGRSDLLDEFMRALSDSENEIEKWGKSFESIWTKYILNTVRKKIADNAINSLIEQINQANADGEITSEEFEDLKRFWEIQGQKAQVEMEMLETIYGITNDIDEAARRVGATNALARASQDSIDELTGGVYALRMAAADIRNYSREQLMVQQSMLNNLSIIAQYAEYLERLDGMSRDLEDIKTRGIIVKT